MAADADAPEGEMSDTETTKESSTESEKSSPSDSSSTEDEATTADEAEETADADAESATDEDADSEEADAAADDVDAAPTKRRISVSPVRLAIAVGVVAILALGGVVGWLGYRTYQLREEQQQRELFLRVARQGAVNLTTIDYQNVNSDIQRILDSATGRFYDDFSKRSQPFIDVVKKVQSKSVGTVTEAGLESVSGNEARAIVAISVKTSNLGAEDQPPRAWRMRIDVTKVDDGAKVSNVLFVPS
jgi:Mce-associated membrane protein